MASARQQNRPSAAKQKRSRSAREEARDLCERAQSERAAERAGRSRALLERALALDPECDDAAWWLADYWHGKDNVAKALKYYRLYLKLVPGDPQALHMVASLGGRTMPRRASDGYLREHFDDFAPDFDRSLVRDLKYQVPKLLSDAVREVRGRGAPAMDVLDLGCGTGLVGVRFRRRARRLVGVDLSHKMAVRARKRGVYDAVAVAEITRYLRETKRRYDLITAADVLIYIGDVGPMFHAAVRVLRPGGLLAVSAEAQKRGGFRLTDTGRYAHTLTYLRGEAKRAGLAERLHWKERLRFELGKPAMGHILVFAREG